MSKVSEYYGGTYLSGADLAGQTFRLQVDKVGVEEIGDEREKKLVVSFVNAKKSLVLNKTNASTLVSVWSDETDEWAGRWLEAFTVPVNFNGKVYDGVRVRPVVETAKIVPPTNGDGSAVVGVPAGQGAAARRHAAETLDAIPF